MPRPPTPAAATGNTLTPERVTWVRSALRLDLTPHLENIAANAPGGAPPTGAPPTGAARLFEPLTFDSPAVQAMLNAPPAAVPDQSADPASAPPAPPQHGNAGWQVSVSQGAQVSAHTNLRSGQAQTPDATNQVQGAATYQAHPDGRAGFEVAVTGSYGQTQDRAGQNSTSAGVGVQAGVVVPVGRPVVDGQRVTLGAAAGIGAGVSMADGALSPQLQASLGVQVGVPLSRTISANLNLTEGVTNPQSKEGTADHQLGVGLTATF